MAEKYRFQDLDDFDVDAILEEFQTKKNVVPAAQMQEIHVADDAPPDDDDVIISPGTLPEFLVEDESMPLEDDGIAEEEMRAASGEAPKRNVFMRFFGAIVPHVGDRAFDVVRKCVMLLAVLVFVGSMTYLVDDLVLVPRQNEVLAQTLAEQYDPDVSPVLTGDQANYSYPEGIDPSFKKLYYQNNDIRGWLSFHSSDGGINLEYPIMQTADNDYYLHHDFLRTYNINGTCFFDYRNDFSRQNYQNSNTVIYGHNMSSGQMFAPLNRLIRGVEYARSAPTFTLNTIYRKGEYKVFAVMILNNDPADGTPFGYLRTEFADGVDFAMFLAEVKARSLYDYGDVDLLPTDEIVTLSTCNANQGLPFKNGRTAIVARRVRDGEDVSTDVSKITVNTDVVMPYGWYVNQNLEPHPYYVDANYVITPLDSLGAYMATSTATGTGATTTLPYVTQDGSLVPSTTTSTESTAPTAPGSVEPPATSPPAPPPTQAPPAPPTQAPPTPPPTQAPTEPPSEAPTEAPTEPSSEAPTEPPTEPSEEPSEPLEESTQPPVEPEMPEM